MCWIFSTRAIQMHLIELSVSKRDHQTFFYFETIWLLVFWQSLVARLGFNEMPFAEMNRSSSWL